MIKSQQAHFTKIEVSDGDNFAEIYTNRPRMLRRLRRLQEHFPNECRHVETDDHIEFWLVPYWWFNCRKRPQPQNPPLGSMLQS